MTSMSDVFSSHLIGHATQPLAGEHPDVPVLAMQEHARTGGSTVDPRTGANLAGTRHFAVAVAPEATAIFDTHPTPQDHANFMAQHRDIFARNANSAVGTNHDPETGIHRIEIVAVTPSKKAALEMAAHLGENSIHNLATSESHPTGAMGVSPSHLSIDERFQHVAAQSPKRQAYMGTHFSDGKLDMIDGNRRGAGQTGAEASRVRLGSQTGMGKDAPPGFFTYAAGSLPEAALAQRKNAHSVRGQFAFAPTSHPAFQQGYVEGSQQAAAQGADPQTAHGIGLNHAEHALQDEGFDGYFSPQHPHIRFHFGNHTLETNEAKKHVK